MGSVFSPSYFRARQQHGAHQTNPSDFCTLNVALHGPRGIESWVFSEFPKRLIERSKTHFTLGDTTLVRRDTQLDVDLNAETKPFFQWGMPRRLRGRLTLTPDAEFEQIVHLDTHCRHRWLGLAPRSRIRVKLTEPALEFEGSAYHDANHGLEPLESAFTSWNWSRADLRDGTCVLYDTIEHTGEQRLSGRLYRSNGDIEDVAPAHEVRLRPGLWGVPRRTRTDHGASASVQQTLVDAPFYTRSLVRTHLMGESVISVHESVDLNRFSAGWVRFLLPWKIRRAVSA